jgi:hypothetical protein
VARGAPLFAGVWDRVPESSMTLAGGRVLWLPWDHCRHLAGAGEAEGACPGP